MSVLRVTLAAIAVCAGACAPDGESSSPATASPAITGESEAGASPIEPVASETVFKNTLRWSTASELDNFGYDVYRGKSEDGPFERLTPEPILGAGTTDEPSHYEYVDDTIDPYLAYWYYVESISMSGDRERLTPIYPSKPKLPKSPPEAAATERKDDPDSP